jgi:hypothetical protein
MYIKYILVQDLSQSWLSTAAHALPSVASVIQRRGGPVENTVHSRMLTVSTSNSSGKQLSFHKFGRTVQKSPSQRVPRHISMVSVL